MNPSIEAKQRFFDERNHKNLNDKTNKSLALKEELSLRYERLFMKTKMAKINDVGEKWL
jgi:hypothetical protein